MARPGITREQVFAAAEALRLEGQNPTVVGVRTRLGGGSPNTIAPWLAEWRAQSDQRRAETVPALPPAVESAMRQVWGVAWQETQAQWEAEREALATLRQALERERNELLGEITRLDGELEAARGATRQAAEALEAERREHETTRADVREARAIASERKKRSEDLSVELQEAQRQAAEASAQASRAPALSAERDRALADKDRLAADLRREQETTRQARAALDVGAGKIRKLEEALECERQARQLAEQALADLRVQIATLTERAAQAEALRRLLAGPGAFQAPRMHP